MRIDWFSPGGTSSPPVDERDNANNLGADDDRGADRHVVCHRPSTTAPPVTTTSAAVTTTCQPNQLGIALAKYLQPAMNQPAAYFWLTNTSASTCTLDGYPGFQPYDSAGKPVNLTVERGSTFQIADPGPQLVTLASTSAWDGSPSSNPLAPRRDAAM